MVLNHVEDDAAGLLSPDNGLEMVMKRDKEMSHAVCTGTATSAEVI